MLSTIAEIIRDLLIFVGVIAALLVALVVVVSKLPDTNPLKRVLTALCYRLGATLAAGAVAIPLEPIPGIDVLYDIAVPIALIWYWWTFFQGRSPHDVQPAAAARSPTSHLWRAIRRAPFGHAIFQSVRTGTRVPGRLFLHTPDRRPKA